MPKQLLLVRHAKSDWDNIKLSDFNRPLNSRGKKNAPEMALRLKTKGLLPQQIISSPALRAFTTAEHFAEVLGIEKANIVKEMEIYDALPSTLLNVVNNLDDTSSFSALFGHNPGITNIVQDLCSTDLNNVPTCGMVLIHFPFDTWRMVSAGTGELIFFDFPKNVG
ncbi:MAG: histidine phosphatase family protein [Daejeonella sp.]